MFSHRKKEILPFATTWIDLEDIMLHKTSQIERTSTICTHYIWNKKKSYRERIVVDRSRGWNGVKWEKGVKRYKLSVIF